MSKFKLKFSDKNLNKAISNDYEGTLMEAVQLTITGIKNEAWIMNAHLIDLCNDIVIGRIEYIDEDIELTELMGNKMITKSIVGEELILNAFERLKKDVVQMEKEEEQEEEK